MLYAKYKRPCVGILFGIAGLTAQIKDASGTLIVAAGHFKQTQNYIIVEALLNIIISLLLVKTYGITGVLAGTIISHVIANWGYISYANKVILRKDEKQTWKRIIRNLLILTVLAGIEYRLTKDIAAWGNWTLYGFMIALINLGVYFSVNIAFEPENYFKLKKYVIAKWRKDDRL